MSTRRPPTREQLQEIKKEKEAVQYGKGLLEKKKDVLLRKLENDRSRFRQLETEFIRLCREIGAYYSLVRMYEGHSMLQILKPGGRNIKVRETVTSIMGCSYSQFEPQQETEKGIESSYDPALTSLYVDEFMVALNKTGKILWEYINMKTRIVALESELKKSLLKINSLEHIVLPELEEEGRHIVEVLGERARQEQFAVKKIKRKKIAKKKLLREKEVPGDSGKAGRNY